VPQREEALADVVTITDLDPPTKRSRLFTQWVEGHRLVFRTRLCMALFTLLGVALFAVLLVSPWHLTGAGHLTQAPTAGSFTRAQPPPTHPVQMVVEHHVIYLLEPDGQLMALWTRHKYIYVLWQYSAARSYQLVGVMHNVVYLVAPNGSRVALRASDGTVLRAKKTRMANLGGRGAAPKP